ELAVSVSVVPICAVMLFSFSRGVGGRAVSCECCETTHVVDLPFEPFDRPKLRVAVERVLVGAIGNRRQLRRGTEGHGGRGVEKGRARGGRVIYPRLLDQSSCAWSVPLPLVAAPTVSRIVRSTLTVGSRVRISLVSLFSR